MSTLLPLVTTLKIIVTTWFCAYVTTVTTVTTTFSLLCARFFVWHGGMLRGTHSESRIHKGDISVVTVVKVVTQAQNREIEVVTNHLARHKSCYHGIGNRP
jgi:hypothetical protein